MKCTKRITGIAVILALILSLLSMSALAVYTYADNDFKPVEAYGENSLFISDIHAEGATGGRLEQLLNLADPNKDIAIISVGGDYEAGMDYRLGDVTDERSGAACVIATTALIDSYYADSAKHACADEGCNGTHISIVYTKGNHESGKSDWTGISDYTSAEAIALNDEINADFLAFTEWPDSGHVATVYADETKSSVVYYLYAMGWQCNGGNKSMQFSADENVGLMSDFEKWYAETGNDGSIPVFIVSHSPIHYYNDRRTPYHAENAIDTFNKYPNLVFCWGHNHTERDPLYTTVLEAGDLMTIQLDDGTVVEKEILFSYTGLGSIRANGHMNETGFLAQYKGIGESDLTKKSVDLTFYFLENSETMKVLESNGNPLVDEDTTINFYDPAVISRAAVELAAPEAGVAPAAEVEFSDRFNASVNWSPAVDGAFAPGTAYTAEIVLTAEEGYSFAEAPEVYLNDALVSDVKVEGNTVTITCEFETTLYYTDVTADAWYFDYVGALSGRGVINGYSDGTYKPGGNVTYGEALKLVCLAAGLPEQAGTDDHWAGGYLKLASAYGILPASTDLDASITRADVAKLASLLLKYEAKGASPFADTDNVYAVALYEAGIIDGYVAKDGTRTFAPDATITRAEVSKILYVMLGLDKAEEAPEAEVPVATEADNGETCTVTFSDGQTFEATIGEDFVFFFQCDAPGDMGAPAEGEEGAGITVSEGTVTYSNVGLGGPNQYPTSEKVTISGFTGDITVTITEAATNMGATYTIYTEEADIAEAIAFAEQMAAQMAANPMPEEGGELPPEIPAA